MKREPVIGFIKSVVFSLIIVRFKLVCGVRDLLFEDTSLRIREVVDYLTRTSGALLPRRLLHTLQISFRCNVADLGVLRLCSVRSL